MPLFVIIVLGGFGVSSSSTLSGGNGAVDLVVVGCVFQGCGPLPLLPLSRVAAAIVSLRPLLLLLTPSLLTNPLDLVIQKSGNDVSSFLVSRLA